MDLMVKYHFSNKTEVIKNEPVLSHENIDTDNFNKV